MLGFELTWNYQGRMFHHHEKTYSNEKIENEETEKLDIEYANPRRCNGPRTNRNLFRMAATICSVVIAAFVIDKGCRLDNSAAIADFGGERSRGSFSFEPRNMGRQFQEENMDQRPMLEQLKGNDNNNNNNVFPDPYGDRGLDNLRQVLLPISGNDLFVPTTDQYKAMEWVWGNPLLLNTSSSFLKDAYVLSLLHFATNGMEWSNPDIFMNPSAHVCDWHDESDSGGVYCDVTNTKITSIQLRNFNLRGYIPSEISYFSSLQQLNLGSNHLGGTIPKELGGFSHMFEFVIDDNELVGTIPSEIGNIGIHLPNQLHVYLALTKNGLSGSIPSEIGNIPAGVIELGRNSLSGTIPVELTKLVTSLHHLDLGHNELVGPIPTQLGDMTSLQTLHLEYNQLSGLVPSQLGNLSPETFKILRFDNNKLQGTLPTNLGDLHGLEIFNLRNNDITGDISPLFCQLSSPTEYTNDISTLFQQLHIIRADIDCGEHTGSARGSKISCTCCCCVCIDNDVAVVGANTIVIDENLPVIAMNENQNTAGNFTTTDIQHLPVNEPQPSQQQQQQEDDVYVEGGHSANNDNEKTAVNNVTNGTIPVIRNNHNESATVSSATTEIQTLPVNESPPSQQQQEKDDSEEGGHDANNDNENTAVQEEGVVSNEDTENYVGEEEQEQTGGNMDIVVELGSLQKRLSSISGDALYDITSYQYRTICWFVDNGLPLNSSLEETYIVSLLYFATEGSQWIDPDVFMNPMVSICDWNVVDEDSLVGVYCDEYNTSIAGIKLPHHNLVGTIPSELGYLPSLQVLHLQNNHLRGTIPFELGNLGELWTLSLGYNDLTGTIPTEFGNLDSLRALFLPCNRLSGTMPSELGNLSPDHLEYLDLNHNNLSGAIPASLSNLRGLISFDLHDNNLSGNINRFFCQPSSSEGVSMTTVNELFQKLTYLKADTSCVEDSLVNESKIICDCCSCDND